MEWIALLVVIVILGALAGGNSFGETVRVGCGCLLAIILGLLIIAFLTGAFY
jgi:hypothetical protein